MLSWFRSGSTGALMTLLAVPGLVMAMVIMATLRLEDGALLVLGQQMTEYSLARLFAASISLVLPIYLLLPAVTSGSDPGGGREWLIAILAPLALLGPALVAGLGIGGRQLGPPMLALVLLMILLFCLCLWFTLLTRLFHWKAALILYGFIWACSTYLDHLRLYILPYLEELQGLRWLAWLNWLLPQVESGPSAVDDYLQTLQWNRDALLPTLIQLPLLIGVLWLLERYRSRPVAAPTDSSP
jgi:hypothetical protein